MDERISNESIERYSRQLIMPEVGMHGQFKLQSSKALIIGAGGLGCPCAQYLVAAGVGTLGILDYDIVEMNNLHRQILHTEAGATDRTFKAESAAENLQQLNSKCNIIPICVQLTKENAVTIFQGYDIVIDATDNVVSRYLISDVCVLTDKPLVSGSALRWEGQLTTYHYSPKNGLTGPCYRCLYPVPPPPDSVTNCSDGGVIGVVPGVIGCMQALEALKILTGNEPSFHQKLYIFDGLRGVSKTVKLRPRQLSCVCCGENSSISIHKLPNYVDFCGMEAGDKCKILSILTKDERISVTDYQDLISRGYSHILVDVRNPVEIEICALPNTVNIPIGLLRTVSIRSKLGIGNDMTNYKEVATLKCMIEKKLQDAPSNLPYNVFVVCRLGNDSQTAVKIFQNLFGAYEDLVFKDIKGGLMAWARQIDKTMATY